MRPPPPLTDFLKYPVTGSVGVLALVTTAAWHMGGNIEPLVMSFRFWPGQPWRLLSSALPHIDIFHLLFNLYWLWVFGSVVEATFGQLTTLALYCFLAAGSAAAEFAVFRGGVGLSGVGYGLFGLLWVMSSRDERFYGVIDPQTSMLFVAWFFLCIILTVSGVWRVANVAHGIGAALGVLLGFALAGEEGKRSAAVAGLTGLIVIIFAAATLGRPYVNYGDGGREIAHAAYVELEAKRYESGAELYERALEYDNRQAAWWFNLGLARKKLGRRELAIHAFERAVDLEPQDPGFRAALEALRESNDG
jgi:GlpG protein